MGSIVSGIFGGGDAAEEAAEAQERSAQLAIDEQRRQFGLTQEQLRPFVEAGERAVEQEQALLGLLGQQRQQEAISGFQESPGQKFLRERAERSLLRNASAIGGLGGGRVREALQEQAIGIASTDLQNQLNRLGSLRGSGQGTAINIGQFGQTTAGNVGNLLQQQGQARASGILGAQQANAALSGQLLGAGIGALGGAGAFGPGVAQSLGGSAGSGLFRGLLG